MLDIGAMATDESSQLPGQLNHADALRMTYARQHKYGLNPLDYWKPTERHGRIAVSTYWGDHLQLPPVPASSSMLSPLTGTSNEHKAGANKEVPSQGRLLNDEGIFGCKELSADDKDSAQECPIAEENGLRYANL